jgi:biopolymer transport protein ExbD
MKFTRFVCLIALSLIVNSTHHSTAQTPPMTTGVSVQMAQTKNAAAYPSADTADAWIVAITADGQIFFGMKSVTPDQLFEAMKSTPRRRDAKLYVKADARSTFSSLKSALGPVRTADFEQVVFLTSQSASASSSGIVPPNGIEVQIAPGRHDVALRISSSPQGPPTVTLNDKTVEWSELGSTLRKQVHPGQTVLVEASDAVRFTDLMKVIDAAHAGQAAVALPMFHSI